MQQTQTQKEEIKMTKLTNGILGETKRDGFLRLEAATFNDSTIPFSFGHLQTKNSFAHFEVNQSYEEFIESNELIETRISENDHWKLRELYQTSKTLESFLHIQIMGGSHMTTIDSLREILKDESGAVATTKKLVIVNNEIHKILGIKKTLVVGAKEIKQICLNTRPTLLSRNADYWKDGKKKNGEYKTPEFSLIFLSPYDSKTLAAYKREKKYGISKDLVIGQKVADPVKTKGAFKTV